MKTKGIWVSPSEFVQFSEPSNKLSDQIATRGRSIDFYALGMYLPNPDPVLKALGKDIKVYRELRADAHVGGCIRRRKAAVKALEWGLDRDKAFFGKLDEGFANRLAADGVSFADLGFGQGLAGTQFAANDGFAQMPIELGADRYRANMLEFTFGGRFFLLQKSLRE